MPRAAPQPDNWGTYELVAFDVRVPGAVKLLISVGSAWRGRAHVELLDPHHAILVIRASGARDTKRGRVV